MSYLKFHPGTGFFDLKLVRGILWSAVVWFGLSTAIFSISAKGLDLCWSVECLNFYFLTVLRIPLGGLAVIAAVLALLATHHRSEQSKELIAQSSKSAIASQESLLQSEIALEEAQKHNNFTNYFTSLAEFRDHMSDFEYRILDERKFHSIVFAHSLSGDYSVSDHYLSVCESFVGQIRLRAGAFLTNDREEHAKGLISIHKSCRELESLLGYVVAQKTTNNKLVPRNELKLENVLKSHRSTTDWLEEMRLYCLLLARAVTFFPTFNNERERKVANQLANLAEAVRRIPNDKGLKGQELVKPFDLEYYLQNVELDTPVPQKFIDEWDGEKM